MELPKKYPTLKVGDKLKINGNVYTIKEKSYTTKERTGHKPSIESIRYELGNQFVLEYDTNWTFFQLVTRKGWFGMQITSSKRINIEAISIVH